VPFLFNHSFFWYLCYLVFAQITEMHYHGKLFCTKATNSATLFFCIYIWIWSVTSGLRRPSPVTCAVGHAATFAVNTELVASQWQHRARAVSLHPSINAEREAGQVASPVFQVFDMTRLGIEPKLPAAVARALSHWVSGLYYFSGASIIQFWQLVWQKV